MAKTRKAVTAEGADGIALLVEKIADHIANDGYWSFDLDMVSAPVMKTLTQMRHMGGLKLLNTIAVIYNRRDAGYLETYVAKVRNAARPRNPAADAEAFTQTRH